MKNNDLKNRLDSALSGIQEDPWLYQKVMNRAHQKKIEKKRKISYSTIIIITVLILTMGVAIAAVSGWNVIHYLFDGYGSKRKVPEIEITMVDKEAVTDNACLKIASATYDGRMLAFDWFIENKHPEVPMYCRVASFTGNGVKLWMDGCDDFEENWMPGAFWDNCCQGGELIEVPEEIVGADTIHIELKVSLFRPERPVVHIPGYESFDPSLAAQKVAEGYYVIPDSEEGGGDGFIIYYEPEGWGHYFMPEELPTGMGEYNVETLEISFDVPKNEISVRQLETEEVYENEHGTAYYTKAELSDLGLYLALTNNATDDYFMQEGWWYLTDGEGNILVNWDENMPHMEGWSSGSKYANYHWYGLMDEELPDIISLSWIPENGEAIVFPVKVR